MAREDRSIDVFIIYARGDGMAAQSLATALRARGLTPFSDHDLRLGDTWDVLPAKLLDARSVAVVISRRWPEIGERGETWYGPEEVAIAIQRARGLDHRPRLLPIWLDGAADRTPYGLRRVVGIDVRQHGFDAAADGIAAVLGEDDGAQAATPGVTTAERLLAPAWWAHLWSGPGGCMLAGVALLVSAALGLLFAAESRAPGCRKLLVVGGILLVICLVMRNPGFIERPRAFQVVVLAVLMIAAVGFGAVGVHQLVVPPDLEGAPVPHGPGDGPSAPASPSPEAIVRGADASIAGASAGRGVGVRPDGSVERADGSVGRGVGVRPDGSVERADGSVERADVGSAGQVEDRSGGAAPTARPAPGLPGFMEVPAGSFVMGSPRDEDGHSVEEGPQHRVTFSRPLWVQKHEVTQGEWRRLMGTTPSYRSGCDNCPVERVNWFEAAAYANARSRAEGLAECYTLKDCGQGERGAGCADGEKGCFDGAWSCATAKLGGVHCAGYRLPTEAEWEYFARAGTTTRFSSGDTEADLAQAGRYRGNSEGKTHPVGGKAANRWGLHDVHGNVSEWCHDWYKEYGAEPATDPLGPPTGLNRIHRGGSFAGTARVARSAIRGVWWPRSRGREVGFRLVRAPRAP